MKGKNAKTDSGVRRVFCHFYNSVSRDAREVAEHCLSVDFGEVKTWNGWELYGWNFHGVPLAMGNVYLVLASVTDTANYCKQYRKLCEMGAEKQPTSLIEP